MEKGDEVKTENVHGQGEEEPSEEEPSMEPTVLPEQDEEMGDENLCSNENVRDENLIKNHSGFSEKVNNDVSIVSDQKDRFDENAPVSRH